MESCRSAFTCSLRVIAAIWRNAQAYSASLLLHAYAGASCMCIVHCAAAGAL